MRCLLALSLSACLIGPATLTAGEPAPAKAAEQLLHRRAAAAKAQSDIDARLERLSAAMAAAERSNGGPVVLPPLPPWPATARVSNPALGLVAIDLGDGLGMFVVSVSPRKTAGHSGVKPGDVIVAWLSGEIFDDSPRAFPMDAASFPRVPPRVATMNTIYGIRVTRAGKSLDLPVVFAQGD